MPKPYTGKDYKRIYIPEHPLSNSHGMLGLHRAVLFQKIGPGSHPCHWCGKEVSWTNRAGSSSKGLVSDHVDGDRTNNDLSNLVPSCGGCNILRTRGLRIKDGELYLVNCQGARCRAVRFNCILCGKEHVTVQSRQHEFCSRGCSNKFHHIEKRLALVRRTG